MSASPITRISGLSASFTIAVLHHRERLERARRGPNMKIIPHRAECRTEETRRRGELAKDLPDGEVVALVATVLPHLVVQRDADIRPVLTAMAGAFARGVEA